MQTKLINKIRTSMKYIWMSIPQLKAKTRGMFLSETNNIILQTQ